MARPVCPNCGVTLDPPPNRKTLCPECHQPILVRQGRLVTEEQVEVQGWVNRLGYLGLTTPMFDRLRARLSERFGTRASVGDTVWQFLNKAATEGDWRHREQCFLTMAEIAEAEGRSPEPFHKEARRWEAEDARAVLNKFRQERIVSHVRINTCSDDKVCSQCRALEGRVITVQQALSELPVPNQCEHACRCWYTAAPVDGLRDVLDYAARKPKRGRRRKGCLATLAAILFPLISLLH